MRPLSSRDPSTSLPGPRLSPSPEIAKRFRGFNPGKALPFTGRSGGAGRVSPREKNPHRLKFLKFWFPVFLYSGIIFWASSLPNLKPPVDFFNIDKVCHILEYAVLGFLLARAFHVQYPAWSAGKTWRLVALCAFLYGISDEYHQSFVPGRESAVFDAVADTVGGFLGAYLYSVFLKKTRSTQKVGL
ncbi:MAG: VanZ family protein [Candidatus Omnitrophica bacterium]|nr:VanZ family protein [Candidatus Omnitrophota bacterium]